MIDWLQVFEDALPYESFLDKYAASTQRSRWDGMHQRFLLTAEQRRLLQVVVEKAAWKHGKLQTALFEPFEILRRSNRESSTKEKDNAGSGRDLGIWLPA